MSGPQGLGLGSGCWWAQMQSCRSGFPRGWGGGAGATMILLPPRADNWLVDKGDDKAQSQGLSLFGKVSDRGKNQSPSEETGPRRQCPTY